MGKFLEILETETRPQTKIEQALCACGFPYSKKSLAWERVFSAGAYTVTACVNTQTGKLHVRKTCSGALEWDTYGIPRVLLEKDSPESFLLWLDEKLELWLPEGNAQKEKPEEPAQEKERKTGAALISAGFVQGKTPGCWEKQITTADGAVVRGNLNLRVNKLYISVKGGYGCGGAYNIPKEVREGAPERVASWAAKKLEQHHTPQHTGK